MHLKITASFTGPLQHTPVSFNSIRAAKSVQPPHLTHNLCLTHTEGCVCIVFSFIHRKEINVVQLFLGENVFLRKLNQASSWKSYITITTVDYYHWSALQKN